MIKMKRFSQIFLMIAVFMWLVVHGAAEENHASLEKSDPALISRQNATGVDLTRLSAFIGEKLNYSMIYKGLPSARAELRLQRNGDGFDITLTAHTRPLFDALFKIDNWYTVTLSADGKMQSVAKQIVQKNIRQDMTIHYDWERLRASTPDHEWPILPVCEHLLSMLYGVRLQNPQLGDSLSYILDVESQLWQIAGVVTQMTENPAERQIIFSFTPVLPIHRRAWRTDLLTHRLARTNSQLIVRLGPPPQNVPRFISFGGNENRVEMKLGK
jgi:hypothetical protein